MPLFCESIFTAVKGRYPDASGSDDDGSLPPPPGHSCDFTADFAFICPGDTRWSWTGRLFEVCSSGNVTATERQTEENLLQALNLGSGGLRSRYARGKCVCVQVLRVLPRKRKRRLKSQNVTLLTNMLPQISFEKYSRKNLPAIFF